jgi:hypothetical protein
MYSKREINKEAQQTGRRLFNYAAVFKKKNNSSMKDKKSARVHSKSSATFGDQKYSVKSPSVSKLQNGTSPTPSYLNRTSRNYELFNHNSPVSCSKSDRSEGKYKKK